MKFLHILTYCCIASFFLLFISCNNEKEYKDKEYNFTKNVLWDDPEMSDLQLYEFYDMIEKEIGPQMAHYINACDSMTMPQERAEEILDSITNTNIKYKGWLRVFFLNYSLCIYPDNKMTKEKAMEYMDRLYEICEGDDPVSQSIFLCFWNNLMITLSNVMAYDEIHMESQNLLRICEKQNMPLGSMFAYIALGYCLMDEDDNVMAKEQFMQADSIAQRYFPTLLGEEWKEKSIDSSDILAIYTSMKLLQLRCAADCKDTAWIKKNEEDIFDIKKKSEDVVDNATILNFMAKYYNEIGNEAMYQKMINESGMLLRKHNMMNQRDKNSVYYNCCTFYYQAKVEHALKHHRTKEAEELMKKIPEFFNINRFDLSVELYRQQGKTKEALETLLKIHEIAKAKLNGRNRNNITAIASSTAMHEQQMQLMQVKVDHANTQIRYNIILLVLALALIIALTYFLIHQRRMNRKLNHALRAAEKANAAKDIFLKNMTHELHTPLNHISGFAQILADRSMPLDEESTREMADAINNGSQQLTNILDNVIDVTDKLTKLDKLEDVDTIFKNK